MGLTHQNILVPPPPPQRTTICYNRSPLGCLTLPIPPDSFTNCSHYHLSSNALLHNGHRVMWHSHRLGTQTHYQRGDWRRLHFQHISFITACFQIVFVSLVCRYHVFSWNRTDVWGITASDAMEASLSFSSLLSLSPLFFCSLQLTFPLLFPFYGWPITIPDQSDPDIAPSLFLGHWP